MGKIISLGEYNKLYKYLWIYVAIRVVNEYFFGNSFPKQLVIGLFKSDNFPPNRIIQEKFNYLGGFFFSIFFHFYEKKQIKIIYKEENEEQKTNTDSISSNKIEYIHNEYDPTDVSNLPLITVLIPIVLSIIALTSMNIYQIIGLDGLDYWVLDLFFMAYLTKFIFNRPVYGHKKIALLIIFIFSTLFKSISTILLANDKDHRIIYKDYPIFIPFGIVIYILFSLLRNYSLCKIKWLLEYKYVKLSDILIIYNTVGTILLFIASMISNFVKCVDKEEFDDIDLICNIALIKGNSTEYYFDEYTHFFGKLWKTDINAWLNFLYIILFLIKLFANFLKLLYSLLIIKHLNPEFYLCPTFIYFFVFKILKIIDEIFKHNNTLSEIFNAIAEAVGIIGIMIYLELIELRFLNLNRELRKNIEMRAMTEYKRDSLNKNEDINNIAGYL